MTDDVRSLLVEAIRMTVRETVAELRKDGFLRSKDDAMYQSSAKLIKAYYDAISAGKEPDAKMEQAIESIGKDEYSQIIPMYYQDRMTVEEIAGAYVCDISTITRNKKRLCIEIFSIYQG